MAQKRKQGNRNRAKEFNGQYDDTMIKEEMNKGEKKEEPASKAKQAHFGIDEDQSGGNERRNGITEAQNAEGEEDGENNPTKTKERIFWCWPNCNGYPQRQREWIH